MKPISMSVGMSAIDNLTGTETCWDMTESRHVVDAIARTMPIIRFGLDGTVLFANDRYLNIFGMDAVDVIGRHHSVFIRPHEAASAGYAMFWNTLRTGRSMQSEFCRVGKDGREVWLQATYMTIGDPVGEPREILKIAQDVTNAREHAADHQSMLEAISRSTAIIEFALDGTILSANAHYLAITGYTEFAIRGRHHRMFLTPEDAHDPSYDRFWERLRRGEFIRSEFRRIGSDGRPIWLQASYNPILDANGKPTRIVKIATDITESVELHNETTRHAFSDALTAVANRRRFNMTLVDEIRRAARTGNDLSLILVDIDYFKTFNDTYGHQQGDACLKAVANAIRGVVRRASDLVARFGGEEFAVLLPNATTRTAAIVAENIRAAIEALQVEHPDPSKAVLTVSAGYASLGSERLTTDLLATDLIERADRALYRAKAAGRNRVSGEARVMPQPRVTMIPNASKPVT